jgi:two-component system sensor histidine kinase/response regulator
VNPLQPDDPQAGSSPPPTKWTTIVTQTRLAKPRIYLVEDDNFSRKLMGMYLNSIEAEVALLSNGQECIQRVSQLQPDLILMDCQMKEMDGFQTVACLRSKGYNGIVLALTADADPETLERCAAVGMNGHIAKPVDAATLRQRIAAALGSSQIQADDDPLERLRRMSAQNPQQMAPLIGLFIQAVDESIAQIRTALEHNDTQELLAAAHQLRGAAGAFGASNLAKAAGLVEDSKTFELSLPHTQQLLHLWPSVRSYLESEITETQTS